MAELDVIENEVENLKKSDNDQWKAINLLREKFDNILRKWIPVWVSIAMTVMGTLTGSALTVAFMMVRISGNQ